jgi:DNA-binding beta-propeller fold protein YncE
MRNTRAWLAIGLAGAVAIAAPNSASGAFRIAPGDLLVADRGNARILAVDRDTGAVRDFSPRAGSDANLLDAPADLVSLADGSVYVVDQGIHDLIRIDAATGAQSVVQNCILEFPPVCTPVGVGDVPRGIDVIGSEPSFVVAATNELRRVRYEGPPSYLWSSEAMVTNVAGAHREAAYFYYAGIPAELIYTIAERGALLYLNAGMTYPIYDPGLHRVTSLDTNQSGIVYFTETEPDASGCLASASAVRWFNGIALLGPETLWLSGEPLRCPEAIALACRRLASADSAPMAVAASAASPGSGTVKKVGDE